MNISSPTTSFFAKTNYFNLTAPPRPTDNPEAPQPVDVNASFDSNLSPNKLPQSVKKPSRKTFLGRKSSEILSPPDLMSLGSSAPDFDPVSVQVLSSKPAPPSNQKYAFLKRNSVTIKKNSEQAHNENDKLYNYQKNALVGAVNEANEKLDMMKNKPVAELSERSIKVYS